jgi:hypothetical protein
MSKKTGNTPATLGCKAYVRRFRKAAEQLRQEMNHMEEYTAHDECGRLIIEADSLGYLPPIPELRERIDWHTGDGSHDRKPGMQAVYERCPTNLFLDVVGGGQIMGRLIGGRWEPYVDPVRGTARCGGMLPKSQPYILRFPDRERQAAACEWLAELIERASNELTGTSEVGLQRQTVHRNDERDDFIYRCRVERLEYKKIRREIKKRKDWAQIGTDQGVSQALKRYCERNNIDL